MLEHSHMAQMREQHPEWIWNRSDTHVILGVPGSHEVFKTPVEPGNSFSPGVGSYGVSTWVSVDGQLHVPEEKPLSEMEWYFLDNHAPVLVSRWQAGAVRVTSRLFTDGDIVLSDIKDYLAVELSNPTTSAIELTFYLAIRSFGATGAAIKKLAWNGEAVVVNRSPVIYPAEQPTGFGAISYAESKSDISVSLRTGKLPSQTEVVDDSTWASGALAYTITLAPGQSRQFDFVFHIHANHPKLVWLKPPEQTPSLDQRQHAFVERWQTDLSIRLDLPDVRFADGFFAQLLHLAMFTVADEPRISPVSYPLWWLRDGAYVVTALDKGGFHDFAERAVKRVAHRDAFGGFGAEGDAPGQGIWMLSEHYLLTRSLDFLREVYPHIERKADLLIQMLHTPVPIKKHVEFRTAEMMIAPESDLMCLPADDGLIVGRMDHHFPLLWINGFAYLGLTRAAFCAEALGLDGTRFAQAAEQLLKTLNRRTPELFGKDDRDPNSALWPTGWASRDDQAIQHGFEEFWNTVRCPDGEYTREPLWTYFEAGQAHNYLLLGQRERAWPAIENFLTTHTAPGLYTYFEGSCDENSSLLWQRTRGWDHIRYVTPHGWTAAELFSLLRDCLAREEGGQLIIGSGIPAAWMNSPFSVQDLPTYFGKLSFSYNPADQTAKVKIDRLPPQGIRADFITRVDLEVTSPDKIR